MNWLRRVSGIPLSPPAAAATEGFNAMVQTKNFPLETRGEAVSREALVQAALQEITQNYREASLSPRGTYRVRVYAQHQATLSS